MKLFYAITEIKDAQKKVLDAPVLYFCNKFYVDSNNENVRVHHNTYVQKMQTPFLECYASGCCMVFNAALRKIAVEHLPKCNVLHDYWIFLLANTFGCVVYDDRPLIHYRIHQNNAAGIAYESFFRKLYFLFHARNGKKYDVYDLAEELLVQFDKELNAKQSNILRLIASSRENLIPRIKMFLSKDFTISRKSIKYRIYNKLKILFGRL